MLIVNKSHYLTHTIVTCSDMGRGSDHILQTMFVFNKITFDCFSMFFNIYLDEGIADLLDDLLEFTKIS